METATIPFRLDFKINEKTKSTEVLKILKELHPKYKRFYNQLLFDAPYPEDYMKWKLEKESDSIRTPIPFLKSQILSIELTLWQHLLILQETHTRTNTDNAIRLLNLLKAKPCTLPDEKDYIKW